MVGAGVVHDPVSSAAAIAHEVLAKFAAEVDKSGRFPIESVAALRNAGLLGLCVPVEFGGLGGGPEAFVAVTEVIAQACPSTAMIFVMHTAGTRSILASTRLQRRVKIASDIAMGRHLTTLAFSEKGSRSQFWAPVSRLSPDGKDYSWSATKSWVTSAHYADSYVCSAQKPEAASPSESVVFLLDRREDGVDCQGQFDGMGLRGNDSCPVEIRCARVGEESLLTEPGEGAAFMQFEVLPWFAIGSAAVANGIAQAVTDATVRHLETSKLEHTDSALRDIPVLRVRVAQMSVLTEQARALLKACVQEMMAGSPTAGLRILQSRLSSIEAAVCVTDLGMKAAGGAAFSKHTGIERMFRDARAGWVMAPTADHLQDFIGRVLTGLPLFS